MGSFVLEPYHGRHKRDPIIMSTCDAGSRFMQWRLTEIGTVPCTQHWCKMNYTFT